MIYFAQPADRPSAPVKIGHSANVPARVKQLEAHYGVPLAVLATMDGGRDEERAVHARFAHLRLNGRRKCGVQPEQFRPDPELMAFIGRPLLAGTNPDVVEMDSRAMVGIKASPEWAAWLGRYAKNQRVSIASVIDRALEREAVAQGFDEPAPARLP